MQVPYAFQYSGVVVPPFGCIVTDNTTAGLDLKFVSFALIRCVKTDYLQGVGWLALLCNDAHSSAVPHSHNRLPSTAHCCRHDTDLQHLDEIERLRRPDRHPAVK